MIVGTTKFVKFGKDIEIDPMNTSKSKNRWLFPGTKRFKKKKE